TIKPQSVLLKTNIKTLNDLQKVLGIINWVRPLLDLKNELLAPLFELLKGDTDLNAP
ncbi:PO113 protein, partial [Pelecanoides urinatrix]|nr:PO113 protein [Pelecanoides urinatrix]